MKKYLLAIMALGLFGACNNANKDQAVGVVEESVEVVAVPVQSQPSLPVVKQKADAKPINMRDSLTVDKAKGAVVQKKYQGTMKAPKDTSAVASASATNTTAVMPEEVAYDLTMYYQDGDTIGVYELEAVYPVQGQPQKFVQTGKTTKTVGTPTDQNAVVYVFVPSDGSDVFYFLDNGNTLELLNEELYPATDGGDYTLILEN